MNSTRADLARLLARAAEMRAGGTSWEHVAATLGRSAATCRRWRQKYPELWRRAYAAAALDRLAEGGAEGLLKMREMLRSEDDKTRQSAAKTLTALLPRTCRADDGTAEGPTDPLWEVMKDCTDDEFRHLLDSARALLEINDDPQTAD